MLPTKRTNPNVYNLVKLEIHLGFQSKLHPDILDMINKKLLNDQNQQKLPIHGFQKFKNDVQYDFSVAVFLGILIDFDHSNTILMTP